MFHRFFLLGAYSLDSPRHFARSACHNVGNTVSRMLTPYRSRGNIYAAVCNGRKAFRRITSLRNRDKSWRLLRPSCRIAHRLWFSSSHWDRTQSPPYFCISTFRSDSFSPPLSVIRKRLATRRARFCRFLNLRTAVLQNFASASKGAHSTHSKTSTLYMARLTHLPHLRH